MKITYGLFAVLSLALAAGCNVAAEKKDPAETKEGETDKTTPAEEKAAPLGESGDQANEDSPDSQFYAEQYVHDGLETDDAEAFKDDAPASLALLEDTPPVGETEEVANANEVEEKVAPPTDEDPTANDMKLVDLIVEFVMSLADTDGDGSLSKTEFVDAKYFPDLAIPEDALARIKERRTKLFDKGAGEDALVSQAELGDLLTNVRDHVKKLRVLRFLPYADHLAAAWKVKKKEFDANGDGKLDQDELKKLRDARKETKDKRRVAVLAASYGLCQQYVEKGGTLPDWFKQLQERWDSKIEKKEKFKDKFGDKFKKKPKKEDEKGDKKDDKKPGMNLDDAPVVEPVPTEEAAAEAGSDADVCAPILDRAESFGMAEDVLKILKDKGIIQE